MILKINKTFLEIKNKTLKNIIFILKIILIYFKLIFKIENMRLWMSLKLLLRNKYNAMQFM